MPSAVVRQRGDEAGPIRHHDPASREVDLGHELLDEGDERVAAVVGAHRQQVLGATVHEPGDLAEPGARHVVRREADQLVVVELVGVGGRSSGSTSVWSVIPRAASAASRSPSSSNVTSSRPWCQPGAADRQGGERLAEPGGGSARSVVPSAKRRSGSSVRSSTVTSPRRPCGRPTRPTTTSIPPRIPG